MKYLRAKGDKTDYPFSLSTLRVENPNTSFPREMTDSILAEYGVFPVKESEKPETTVYEKLVEGAPVLIDGEWRQVWEKHPADVPGSVSAAQIRIFLHNAGMLEGVEAKIASMSKEAQIAWEYSTEVQRASPLLEEVAKVFQLTPEQIDQFFIEASYL